MARRRKRKRNLTPKQWAWIGGGVILSAAAGTALYYGVIKPRRKKKAIQDLPRPPLEGARPPPFKRPQEPECGRDYPGFVFDGEGCVPGPETPAGIYVGEQCSDFVFVDGDEGPQLDYLEEVIDEAAESSADPTARSADPTKMATDFFAEFWGECRWPPAPDASERIVHLYQALVYVIGREIIRADGRVLGTSDAADVDEQIADRLSELGLPDFDPTVVPEIKLPSAYKIAVATPVPPAQGQIQPIGP